MTQIPISSVKELFIQNEVDVFYPKYHCVKSLSSPTHRAKGERNKNGNCIKVNYSKFLFNIKKVINYQSNVIFPQVINSGEMKITGSTQEVEN